MRKCFLPIVLLSIVFPTALFAERADLVLIKKADRTMTLFHGHSQLEQYSVALGGEPTGAKRCQGDGKTPEGEYRVESRNSHSAFYRSLKISYPNAADRTAAAALKCNPGGDIMIHGLPNGRGWIGAAHRSIDWTLGCIAVTDEEMDRIWELVAVGTSVKIVP